MRGARRHPRFRVGLVAVLAVAAFALAEGCGKQIPRETESPVDIPRTPEDIKSYVQMLDPNQKLFGGFGQDPRVAIAEMLGKIGPEAKQYGAIPALTRLTKDKNPKVAAAAKEAIAKIEQ
ncbi:MAG: hypothetical protein HYX69_22745 [Planctomycetia bacterium]|nr:hypothetical protein [Planctomycetia bacterium]